MIFESMNSDRFEKFTTSELGKMDRVFGGNVSTCRDNCTDTRTGRYDSGGNVVASSLDGYVEDPSDNKDCQ